MDMALASSSVSPAELQTLFGAVPDAVLTSDASGQVEFLNGAAERLTGCTPAMAVGRPISEVLPLLTESGGTPLESPAETCRRTGGPTGLLLARTAGSVGSSRQVLEISAAPMREAGGELTGFIVFARDVTRARQIARQLSHQATHDALTGLVNRTEFERRLDRALLSAAQEGTRHVLGFLDLDGFKLINDACGHLAGDQLLRDVSGRICEVMRARDTVARLGGDEFGILLEHCSTTQAVRIAKEIGQTVNDHRFTCNGRMHQIGASIGIVPLEDGSASPIQLLRAADVACYQAKRKGGGRIQLAGVGAYPSSEYSLVELPSSA
jgi:diguanylate cyclase (GGDEF)-like protein/PAS domain S-box-containing protein